MFTSCDSSSNGAVTADLCLPATPIAAAQARHALAALTCDPLLVDDGRLLVTEAVANAVEHTDTAQIHVLLRHEPAPDQRLLCAVRDTSPTVPDPAPRLAQGAGRETEDGRGLQLIESLAETWGYMPDEHGKWLWFSLVPENSTAA